MISNKLQESIREEEDKQMTKTPNSLRIHIGIFGKTNSGKSSLLNAMTNHEYAIVSSVAGTTADPVHKTMEIAGIGAVLLTDTAGFCDETELGEKRLIKTFDSLNRTDIILALFSAEDDSDDFAWFEKLTPFKNQKLIPVITKIDAVSAEKATSLKCEVQNITGEMPVFVSAPQRSGIDVLFERIKALSGREKRNESLTGNLCAEGDLVLLVMPQDIQAPKGRLILPQVQVLRELLDKKCVVSCCEVNMLPKMLTELKRAPKLIITDSQAFKIVFDAKSDESMLTSFSVLMASSKGDIELFRNGADQIKRLTNDSKVLIAEACTHVPLEEDIGRVKIPRMLRKIAPEMQIDFVRGSDFPHVLADENGNRIYDLIIQCGSCMFNRTYVTYRQTLALNSGTPMTNYGLAIAQMAGILGNVAIPGLTE